jgi:phytoene dehydrogenase-like protein
MCHLSSMTSVRGSTEPFDARDTRADVVVVGAGHNGLVAASVLAGAGMAVLVLETADRIGGACRTEHPFSAAPDLPASTGAYLLGPMPPEIPELLDISVPMIRRDPHYLLPPRATDRGRPPLLLGADPAANRTAIGRYASPADAAAAEAMGAELSALIADLAPSWLAEPLPVADTADRYVRPELRPAFVDLVTGSAIDWLSRFGFTDESLIAMYAVTDGMPGLTGSPDDPGPWSPGSGFNLLVHNMCRLPGADGTWMAVSGGMGTVTDALAGAARRAGARIRTSTSVVRILTSAGSAGSAGAVDGVALADGTVIGTSAVIIATDPFRIPGLLGTACPEPLRDRLADLAARSAGQTMKINLALSGRPVFPGLAEAGIAVGSAQDATVHLLPPPGPHGSVLTAVRDGYLAAASGRTDTVPPVEWYLSGLTDPAGHRSSGLFVQGVPHVPTGSDWATAKDGYVRRVLDTVAEYVPDLPDLVVDVQALSPADIESHFGITGGNIHHVDNVFGFTERVPYRLGVAGAYAGGAGCHPAGSVIGCAGHNAARMLLADR